MNLGTESETLEFKTTTNELKDSMKDICAILNKHMEGTLYFGVLNNGEVKGQMVADSTLRDVSRTIKEEIEPTISFEVYKETYDGKDVIKVKFKGEHPPYQANGLSYMRFADESRKLNMTELKMLFRKIDYSNPWELQPTKYTIDDIDDEALESYYREGITCGRINLPSFDKIKLLTMLDLLHDGKLNNAGYYLFGNNVRLNLKCAVFVTNEKLNFFDLRQETNNIYKLIDYGTSYINERMNWRVEFGVRQRIEIPEIPLRAIREILINAFAHGQYENMTGHEINIYPNRIEIYNPGPFPEGLTPNDFITGARSSMKRNKLIMETLYRCKDVESEGTGFKRVTEMCEKENIKWGYEADRLGFKFIFYRPSLPQQSNNSFETQKDIIDKSQENNILSTPSDLKDIEYVVYNLIKNNPKITNLVLQSKVNKAEHTIIRITNSLSAKGYIKRIGANRFGYWEILK